MSTEIQVNPANGTTREKAFHKTAVLPPLDVYQNADEYLVVADLPGVPADALHVKVESGVLTFEGRALLDLGPSGEKVERLYGRQLRIPEGIDAERITAEASNGLLLIRLPKSEKEKPRKIPVRVG